MSKERALARASAEVSASQKGFEMAGELEPALAMALGDMSAMEKGSRRLAQHHLWPCRTSGWCLWYRRIESSEARIISGEVQGIKPFVV